MKQDDSQERTESATSKRLRDAKERGQVPRSKELSTFFVVLSATVALFVFWKKITISFAQIMRASFQIKREIIFLPDASILAFKSFILMAIKSVFPVFAIIVIAAIAAPLFLGGIIFNLDIASPKWERISFAQGLKRMLSMRALMELIKAILKFLVIGTAGFLMLWYQLPKLLTANLGSAVHHITQHIENVGWFFIFLSALLILFVLVDVPFQLWQHLSQLKMTRQELKDEMKESEGRPEVKSQIRRMQQHLARQRMMKDVPKADVIITNPQHYAVALAYDRRGKRAPRVLAKGKNLIAEQIRKLAEVHHILLLPAPPLARALYYSTEVQAEIPRGLYVAVAQVLAYVYQLKQQKKPLKKVPDWLSTLPIPDELKRDE